MSESRRMSKSELFAHFAKRFGIRRSEAGEFFDEAAAADRAVAVAVLGVRGSSCFRESRS